MVRHVIAGSEGGHVLLDTANAPTIPAGGTVAPSTDFSRSGTYSLKCATVGTSGVASLAYGPGGAISSGTTIHFRVWIYLPADLGGTVALASVASMYRIYFLSGGTLGLRTIAGASIGATDVTCPIGSWFSVEVSATFQSAANETVSWSVDGTTVDTGLSANLSSSSTVFFSVGFITAPGTNKTVYFDDMAFNDSTGASENAAPNRTGKVLMLVPSSISSAGSWTGGGGVNAPTAAAIDTIPPAGTASETDSTQIESAATTSTTLTAVTGTYTAAGIGAGDTVTLVRAVCVDGEDVSTGTKTGTVRVSANPADSGAVSFNYGDDLGALGTFPTLWSVHYGNFAYAPSVTLGTGASLDIADTDTSNRVTSCCFLGLIVEYVPSTSTPKSASDSQSLSITDSAAGTAAYTNADTRTLSITDSATFTYPLSASADSSSLSIVDAASVDLGALAKQSDDTQTLTATDTASGSAAYTLADSRVLTSTDTSILSADSTLADSRALSIVDTATVATANATADSRTLTATDTAVAAADSTLADTRALSITDSATVAVATQADDTRTLSITDSASFTYPLSSSADSRVLSIVDTATVDVGAVSTQADDTQALTSIDSATGIADYVDADTRALTSTDTASLAAANTLADSRVLTSVDTAFVSSPVAATDTQALTATDTTDGSASYTNADSRALAIADSATFTYPLSSSADTRVLSIVDSAVASAPAQADDTRTLSIADSVSLALAVADTCTLVATDTATIASAISATADTRTLTATDAATLSLTAADTRTLSLAETAGIGLAIADTRTLSAAETLAMGASATDTRVLILIDTATVLAVAAGYRRRMVMRIG